MTAARMIVTQDHEGQKFMAGTLRFDLSKGAMILIKRVNDEYHLIALSGDGRRGDTSRETLLSFVDPAQLGVAGANSAST